MYSFQILYTIPFAFSQKLKKKKKRMTLILKSNEINFNVNSKLHFISYDK